jgi:hypothetical protein
VAGALKVEVTSERGALVFVDPDGARHVCQTPEDAWELLEDLALQVQEGGAELAKKKPEAEPKRRRSRRKVAQDRRAAESGHQSEAKTAANPEGLAHVEVGAVSRSRPNHEPPPSAEEPTDEPEEEFGAWERGFARIAHGVIKKGGEISSTSKFGRGGRFGRPKGT